MLHQVGSNGATGLCVLLPATAPSHPPPPGSVCCAASCLRCPPRSLGVQRGRRRASMFAPLTDSGKERGSVSGVVFIPLCPLRVLRRFLPTEPDVYERGSILSVNSDDDNDEDDDDL